MGKALKSKSRHSRRQDAVSGDVSRGAHSTDSKTPETNPFATKESAPSAIISKLNSIDSDKRLGALIMLNDLLIQNQSRPVALEKLTCSETLSALSFRLLDANLEVVQQAVLCLTTISRIGREYVEKLGIVGIDTAVIRLLSESMLLLSPPMDHSAPQNTLLRILLELVKVMFVSSVIFAENHLVAVASLILQYSPKLQLHVAVAEFVHELTLADSAICQKLYAGQLHCQLKGVLHLTPVDVVANDDSRRSVLTMYLDTLLSATLFCVLSSSAQNARDDVTSFMLQRLINRVRLQREALTCSSCTSMLVDSAAAPSNSSCPGDSSADRAVVIKVILCPE